MKIVEEFNREFAGWQKVGERNQIWHVVKAWLQEKVKGKPTVIMEIYEEKDDRHKIRFFLWKVQEKKLAKYLLIEACKYWGRKLKEVAYELVEWGK